MERSELIFRKAMTADLDAVCELYRAAAKSPFSVWNEEYPSWREAVHDLETGNLFVLVYADTLVGTVSIVPESEMDDMEVWAYSNGNPREIARIAVSPAFQGLGLASKLVKAILNVLRERGYTSVRLSAACCNLPACKTYRKLGFHIQGEADLYGSRYFLWRKNYNQTE